MKKPILGRRNRSKVKSCSPYWSNACYSKAFGDRPRNLEPWSNYEDDIRAGTHSPNYHTTRTVGRLSSRQI
ncbi:hypothetical protein TNCV_1883391 [Trichonephila clavipes]|nr:hypothetical protein TNCV_1883391 [Trichonephila clavipes]